MFYRISPGQTKVTFKVTDIPPIIDAPLQNMNYMHEHFSTYSFQVIKNLSYTVNLNENLCSIF